MLSHFLLLVLEDATEAVMAAITGAHTSSSWFPYITFNPDSHDSERATPYYGFNASQKMSVY